MEEEPEALYTCCAGIDVHKDVLAVCVASGPLDRRPRFIEESFGTTASELARLSGWLREQQVQIVGMESTGVYWRPLYRELRASLEIEVRVANPVQVKPRKQGDKRDKADAKSMARLLRRGDFPNSYIVEGQQRELRDWSRIRIQAIQNLSQARNRVHKLLEENGVKLSSVLSNCFGVSGSKLLDLLLESAESGRPITAEQVEELTLGKARTKTEQLVEALQVQLTPHQVEVIRFQRDSVAWFEQQVERADSAIAKIMAANADFEAARDLLVTLPGIGATAASVLVAEIGPKPQEHFPNAEALAAWAGLAPGNNESAGRRGRSHKRPGNKFVQSILVQAAVSISRIKQPNRLTNIYRRHLRRFGTKNVNSARFATAHHLLRIAYRLLSGNQAYIEYGDSFERLHEARRIDHARKVLESNGYTVSETAA